MAYTFKAELVTKVPLETAERFITNPKFGLQEKRNGHRRTIFREGDEVFSLNRKGIRRDVPASLAAALRLHPMKRFIIDGELEGDVFQIFDALVLDTNLLASERYDIRIQAADMNFDGFHAQVKVVPIVRSEEAKRARFAQLQLEKAEGVVFKNLDAPYKEGESLQHFAVKFWKTCDAFVIQYNQEGHDSVELGVYDEKGKVHRICGASLLGKVRLMPGDCVELKYLYATRTRHVVQPTILAKRDDKAPLECVISQLIINRDMED